MISKFRKSFITPGAFVSEPVTILVEALEANEFKGINIESLEGEYSSPEAFELAYKRHVASVEVFSDKIYNFIPMTLKTAITLRDTLTKAIESSRA